MSEWKEVKKELLKNPKVRFYYYLEKLRFWKP